MPSPRSHSPAMPPSPPCTREEVSAIAQTAELFVGTSVFLG